MVHGWLVTDTAAVTLNAVTTVVDILTCAALTTTAATVTHMPIAAITIAEIPITATFLLFITLLRTTVGLITRGPPRSLMAGAGADLPGTDTMAVTLRRLRFTHIRLCG